MITYKRCSEVEASKVYEAFSEGFIDYIIKIQMPEEIFFNRFFGPEGNSMKNSFIALDNEKAIGLVLGGLKVYEGIKTMRCGTMCMRPEYRGKGISENLFQLFIDNSKKQECKQVFLEVIVGNARAINFYKSLGYNKVYDISYFALQESNQLIKEYDKRYDIKDIEYNKLRELREGLVADIHINWQNDIDYIEKSENQFNFGVYENEKLIGAISLNKSFKLNFIWVHPSYRLRGIGKALLGYGMKKIGIDKVSAGIANNSKLEGFLRHIGFQQNPLTQYEMYMEI